MSARHLPVRPDAHQLRHQAEDLLNAIRAEDAPAIEDLRTFHPRKLKPADVTLADAQLVLARSYQAPSWTRLMLACSLIDAIWEDDVDTVRELVTAHPYLLNEEVRAAASNRCVSPFETILPTVRQMAAISNEGAALCCPQCPAGS